MYTLFRQALLIVLLILAGAIGALLFDKGTEAYAQWQFDKHLSELGEIENFKTAADYITRIAQEKGGAYAFELLINVDFEQGLDTHLLGHFAGNVLFTQEALDGMRFCTEDLWYACAHSVVINALLQKGMEVFDVIEDICKQVPGPVGYDLCFHGFGHGVIAYAEYELPKALELCKLLGNREAHECAGGVIMDLRDGMHDKELWRKFGQKYIPEGNPTLLCESEHVPDEFRHMCMTYITPFIFDKVSAGKDISTDAEIEKSLAYCEEVKDDGLRRSCYGGFPKELISLIHGRDVRVYEQSSNEDLEKLYALCALAPSELGKESCVLQSVGALDRKGTHPYTLALRYCELLGEPYFQDICFKRLIHERASARIPAAENDGLCEALPEAYTTDCSAAIVHTQ